MTSRNITQVPLGDGHGGYQILARATSHEGQLVSLTISEGRSWEENPQSRIMLTWSEVVALVELVKPGGGYEL